MKRLALQLSLIGVILLPIVAHIFAQGFGSFAFDQPFLAKDVATSSSWIPSNDTNARYWWIANDLAAATVTTWTDRIAGAALTMDNASQRPTNDPNYGVAFFGTKFLTNATLPNLYADSTGGDGGYTVFMVVYSTGWDVGSDRQLVAATASGFDFSGFWIGGGSIDALIWSTYPGGNFGNKTLVGSGWKDIIIDVNPNANLNAIGTGYTNNVVLPNVDRPFGAFWSGGGMSMGNNLAGTMPGDFYFAELLFQTNRASVTVRSNLHNYATNKYQYSP